MEPFDSRWMPLNTSPPEPCPYLEGREARLECGLIVGPEPAELDELLASGYRRLGRVFFRPACDGCRECVPLRVPTRTFVPSKSQRRVLRRGAAVEVEWREPHYDPAHLDLYRAHLRQVTGRDEDTSEQTYRQLLVDTCVDTRMAIYRLDGALFGLSILDVGERAVSSVYFCWHPSMARWSPGTLSALRELAWCGEHGRDLYYLGYRVDGCPAMAYKSRFRPFEQMDWDGERWV